MTIQDRKELMTSAVLRKIEELSNMRNTLTGENSLELYEKINNSIQNLKRLLNKENVFNSVENLNFMKKKFPIFYFCEVDFTDKVTFYNSIYGLILNGKNVVELLTDRNFVKLVLTANDPEIIPCYIELVKKCDINLTLESFESFLEPLMSTGDEWNRYHLVLRSPEDRFCALGTRLNHLTFLREDEIKTSIFTSKPVLETLMKSDQCQDFWFVSRRVYTLPRPVHIKIIKYIKSGIFTKESVDEFINNLLLSNKHSISEDWNYTRNQIKRLEKRS